MLYHPVKYCTCLLDNKYGEYFVKGGVWYIHHFICKHTYYMSILIKNEHLVILTSLVIYRGRLKDALEETANCSN